MLIRMVLINPLARPSACDFHAARSQYLSFSGIVPPAGIVPPETSPMLRQQPFAVHRRPHNSVPRWFANQILEGLRLFGD
jgi:hypothetical protein